MILLTPLVLTAFTQVAGNQDDLSKLMESISEELKSNHWGELERLSNEYIKVKPNDPKGYELLGVCFGHLQRLPESIAALEKAYSLNPRDPSICQNLAISYCIAKDKDKLLKLIKNSEQIAEFLKVKIIDIDMVFEMITDGDAEAFPASRKQSVSYPKFGPYPTVLPNSLRDTSVFESGFVIFEVTVMPNGHVLKFKRMAGQKPLLTDAEQYLDKIHFQSLPSNEPQVMQKCKLVFRYDRDSHEDNNPKSEKIARMGVGFSAVDAEKNTYRVTSTTVFPKSRGLSFIKTH